MKKIFFKILLSILALFLFGYMIMKISDNTLTAIDVKDKIGQTYEIPICFKYSQVVLNIYSYNEGWNLEKSIVLSKEDIDHNQLNINFIDENGIVNLYYEKNISNDPWYTLENHITSSADIYTLVDRKINYEETPLTMCITYDNDELYKGYINNWNEEKYDFDKYQLSYPLILEEPAQATIVTYQFIK